MKVLILNSGSSSLKYQVFNMENEDVLAKGLVERIGSAGSKFSHKKILAEEIKELEIVKDVNNHKEAISLLVDALQDKEFGMLTDLSEIKAVGHRIVHGGEDFSDSMVIDDKVLSVIEKCSELAPLHNPPNILGVEAAKEYFHDTVQVGVFDTAFHQRIPRKAYLYGLPYELYEKYGIRRYGFHGTSHKYVAERTAQILKTPLEELKIITLHLGNGASIAAVKNGMSVDTSMGLTPLEGLVMGTRTGSFDPAIVPFIMDKENLNLDEINNLLNKKSGVLGLSAVSSDFRDLEQAEEEGNQRAKMALEVFVYNIVKYIGSYYMVMGGIDALVFTAGIGENSNTIRERVCNYLNFAGIEIDKDKNDIRGVEAEISTDNSSFKVFVIPTNEELMIARETKRLSMML
ncbi:acetate/propionate family kinase [Candidatus Contubernalis alkaliaceticus]|uniref:acetate/propionate family kinase n=1 Tax=Candidatus Contubernalis alkaliaceticus TaxID=338645 RepID=UPI001F4C2633|nr:acetate kinase [Candidatus Contubernalis alkalaceticus]